MSTLTQDQIARINEIMSEVDKPEEPAAIEQWEPEALENPSFNTLTIFRNSTDALYSTISRIRTIEKLARLVHELGGEAEYGEDDASFIYINADGGMKHTDNSVTYYPETVLMTKRCAIKIGEMYEQGRLNFLNPPSKEQST